MTEKITINTESPDHLKLAGLMFLWMGSRKQDQDFVLTDWADRFQSMLSDSGLSYEEFRQITKWAVKENAYTAENLQAARNPVASLWKQWENICRYYSAKLAGDRARARKTWRNGPCPTCDEAEAKHGGQDCEACEKKKHEELIEELWLSLMKCGLVRIRRCTTRAGADSCYIGTDPEHVALVAPSKEELRAHLFRSSIKFISELEDWFYKLHPELDPYYRPDGKHVFAREDDIG